MTSLRDELQSIHDEHGKLTPEVVIGVAADPDHVLHGRFTWDNDEASEKWRLHEARQLIRSVKVTYREATATEPPGRVRAFHAVRTEAGQPKSYEPIERVVQDEFLTKLLLQQAEREWRLLHARYQHLEEFVQMVRGDVSDVAV